VTATLSPVEQRDDEVLRHLAEHADDEPGCVWKIRGITCGHPAKLAALCSHCGKQCGLVCGPHGVIVAASLDAAFHGSCGARGVLSDLIRLVPL
jgi:hypothetical protein